MGLVHHYVMVSRIQWKPFWLATQLYAQNDWTGWQNRANYMTYSHRPHWVARWETCGFSSLTVFWNAHDQNIDIAWKKTTPSVRKISITLQWKKIQFQNGLLQRKLWMCVDGDLAESTKRSASDRLGDLVPQVRARNSPGFFTAWRFYSPFSETFFPMYYTAVPRPTPSSQTLDICTRDAV